MLAVKTKWYPDNVGSNHMTGDQTKFKEFDEKLIGNVKLCVGPIVSIQGKGYILFQCKNENQLLLTNVYYISNLKSNFVSLDQIMEEDSRVELVESLLKMFDRNGALLMKVK